MKKTVGILGGMGPQATACFYGMVVAATPASRDQDHLRVLILSEPQIPDRNDHILRGGDSPLPALLGAARDLERFGADFIAIPCNTAHWFWPAIRDSVQIPVLNIIEETVRAVAARLARGSTVGLLATRATGGSGLYQEGLEAAGFSPLLPREAHQQEVQQVIRDLKEGSDPASTAPRLVPVMDELREGGVAGIIYGCTELSLLPQEGRAGLPLFDSSRLLAEAVVAFALSSCPAAAGPGETRTCTR